MKYLLLVGFGLLAVCQGVPSAYAHEEATTFPINFDNMTDVGGRLRPQTPELSAFPTWTVPVPARLRQRPQPNPGSIHLVDVAIANFDPIFNEGFSSRVFLTFSAPVDEFYVQSCFILMKSSDLQRIVPQNIRGISGPTRSTQFVFNLQPMSSSRLQLNEGEHYVAMIYSSSTTEENFNTCGVFSGMSLNVWPTAYLMMQQ